MFDYRVDNIVLSRTSIPKDLGKYLDKELTFARNLMVKVNESKGAYGFIIRNCIYFTNIKTILTFYIKYLLNLRCLCYVVSFE